jgi:unsaturated chondroitin disaccharide hydrolase
LGRGSGWLATALLLALLAPGAARADAGFRQQLLATLAFSEGRLLDGIAEVGDPTLHPRSTDSVTGRWTTRSASDWTAGFFPGQLWLLYEYTGNPALRAAAEAWTADMASQATATHTHDLGFMILSSLGHAHRITGDPVARDAVVTAAASLSTRFDPDVGATRSWDFGSWQFPVVIDNTMNLELLFRGASWTLDPAETLTWSGQALSHATVTDLQHVRADDTTYHLVDFDPSTGEVLSRETVQGAGDESTWARGQGWGLYGFTVAYREAGEGWLLTTAARLADAFIARLPADGVPYWDFDAPAIPDEPRDSSAAAIAASGLLELSTLVDDPALARGYRDAAEHILSSLMSEAYLSDGIASSGLLLHGTGNRPAGVEVDVSLIYGDYYFVEALLRHRAWFTPPCDDDLDNDGDGLSDYPEDAGCREPDDSSEEYDCLDGIDNDDDELTDLEDPDCTGPSDPLEAPDADHDGVADDGDNCTAMANGPDAGICYSDGVQRDTDGDGHGNPCDGDFDNDAVVNASDVFVFGPDLGTGTSTPDSGTDMNCDGVVNSSDVGLFGPQLGLGAPGP